MIGVSIFLKGDEWWNVKSALLRRLAGDVSVSTRCHVGIVIPSDDDVSEVTYTEFEPGVGRRMQSSTRHVAVGREEGLLWRLIDSVSIVKGDHVAPRDLLLSRVDCFSIAPLTRAHADSLLSDMDVFGPAEMILEFDTTDPVHRLYLWDHLMLKAFVSDGDVFLHYDDMPDSFWGPDDDARFAVSEGYQRWEEADGLFWTEGDFFAIEADVLKPKIPVELPQLGEVVAELTARAPTTRVAGALSYQGSRRISVRDDANVPAVAVVPDPGQQFPDVAEVARKVADYCLSTRFDKHFGFATAGYDASQPGDDYRLASVFCSSLLREFPVMDARVTADGSIQFAVPIALPRRHGGYARALTAWYFSGSHRPRLSTAYVVDDDQALEWARPIYDPISAAGDYSALADEIANEAIFYSEVLRSDGMWSTGGLWIRHDDAASKEFAATVRRRGQAGSVGVFTRRPLGGRVTMWRLGNGDATQVEGRIHFAQAALGLVGIRSHPYLHID